MIRIITADEPAFTSVTVDGTLAGEFVNSVQICCAQASSKGKPLLVYLRDVSTIDEPGRALLRELARSGARLKATGIYSSYVVDAIQTAFAENAEVNTQAE